MRIHIDCLAFLQLARRVARKNGHEGAHHQGSKSGRLAAPLQFSMLRGCLRGCRRRKCKGELGQNTTVGLAIECFVKRALAIKLISRRKLSQQKRRRESACPMRWCVSFLRKGGCCVSLEETE